MYDFQPYPGVSAGQQFAPQGLFGGLLGGPVGGLIGKGIGGLFGNARLGQQIGQAAGGIGGSLLPFGVDPYQLAQLQQQPQQFSPQGFFGNLLGQIGQPLGGAIGGAFGNQNLGSAIGGMAGQIGRMLPFDVDPWTQALLQQQAQQPYQAQPLAPQGFFGNLLGQIGQPLGSAIGGAFGNPHLGGAIGSVASQIGRVLPFQADPNTLALLQQQAQQAYQTQQANQAQQPQQLAPQGFFGNLLGQIGQPLGSAIGGALGNQHLGGVIGGVAGQIGRMLPFQADPNTLALLQLHAQQAYQAQQANQAQQPQQLAPQGFFGNLLGQIGQPLGSAIGGALGNQGLGSALGSVAGQIGQTLPLNQDPAAIAWLQQMQANQAQPYLHGLQGYGAQQQPTIH